jgi:hypothetical protein
MARKYHGLSWLNNDADCNPINIKEALTNNLLESLSVSKTQLIKLET